MKRVIVALALCVCLLAVPAVSSASSNKGVDPVAQTSRATTSTTVNTCAEATRVANFANRRVKKQRKLWRNGFISTRKYKNALRIYKSWLREKNRLCSGGGTPPPGTQQPVALSASEVANRVFSRAAGYCAVDSACYAYGNYDTSTCESKSTYTWSCYGYNLEDNGLTCDFREIVSRTGVNGITSYLDTSYSGGFYCYF
jgi:hypothetical protein